MSGRASTGRTPRAAYVPELDGVRGIAIGGVMALHFVGGVAPTNVLERTAAKISSYGVWGVDLFFVLSGFLITGILIQSKGSAGYLRNFYVRRVLRIFPLYYAVLFVLFVLIPGSVLAWFDPQLVEMRSVQGWLWGYLTNFYLGPKETFSIPYVSHFWSLAIEEHFYLVWPFLILLLTRQTAMRACVVLGLCSLGLRIGFSIATPDQLNAQMLTPCRLDALCAGGWFALSAHGPNALTANSVLRWLRVSAAAILALSLWHLSGGGGDALVLQLRTTLLAVFFGSFIYVAATQSGASLWRAVLRANWLRALGKYSYGLYVYHGLVSYAIHRRPPEFLFHAIPGHTAAAAVQIAFGTALSLLLAIASYELFEARFLTLKKRFEYAEATPAGARPAAVALPARLSCAR
jgi:peptidoglycan/LPS O-acetylase OafA/YrhL